MGERVDIIGGGLAGSECALTLASLGVHVRLFEQRPSHTTPAHSTAGLAELVCSNSLKSTKPDSAAGQLKWELELMGSPVLAIAKACSVPAGGALAVDRERFSTEVTRAVEENPRIELVRERVEALPEGPAVIACGPLASEGLMAALADRLGSGALSFFDAAAPIIDAQTIDRDIVFAQSRYGEQGEGDYLNCPMDKEAYEAFWNELVAADRVILRDFEGADLFQACQPVEEVARTGVDALRFGALKPVGLDDPATGRRPWAAVQLRAENADATAYNMVGFQTNLTWPEQKRVFRMIPGLEHAEFFRLGVMHRNSFVDAPRVLEAGFRIPGTGVRLAGQITGTEGYTEAIGTGHLAALNIASELAGGGEVLLPKTGLLGALVAHASDPATDPYQPQHANFGLVPPLGGPRLKKRERYRAYVERAQKDMLAFTASRPELFGGEA